MLRVLGNALFPRGERSGRLGRLFVILELASAQLLQTNTHIVLGFENFVLRFLNPFINRWLISSLESLRATKKYLKQKQTKKIIKRLQEKGVSTQGKIYSKGAF